jgi:hypothetical protein
VRSGSAYRCVVGESRRQPLLIGTVLFLLLLSHFFSFAAGGELVVEKGDSDDERPSVPYPVGWQHVV